MLAAAATTLAASGARQSASHSAPATPTLRVVTSGRGTVTASGGSLRCPGSCAGAYAAREVITLTARAARYWAFRGWSGDCVGVVPACTVAVGAGADVHALFSRRLAKVSIEVGGPGEVMGTATRLACGVAYAGTDRHCTATVHQGDTITLEAVPAAGGAFAGWGSPCEHAQTAACAITVSTRRTGVTATFGLASPQAGVQTLTATSQRLPAGTPPHSHPAGLTCPGMAPFAACQGSFPSGTLVTLTGAQVWGGACVGDLQSCTVDVDAPTNVTLTEIGILPFTGPPAVGVNVTLSGPGRVVIGAQPKQTCSRLSGLAGCQTLAPLNSRISLTAVPAGAGARLQRWGGACAVAGAHVQCSVSLYQAADIVAAFATPKR